MLPLLMLRLSACRNYALENAMEAANVPLMDLMDRYAQQHNQQQLQPVTAAAQSSRHWRCMYAACVP
jgi:hypothetical protein